MLKTYRFELNPNNEQINYLNRAFGSCRFIYNHMLWLKIKLYEDYNEEFSYNECAKYLTFLKKKENYKWLTEISVECLQQSLRNLDTAYNNFFKSLKTNNRTGFPKFKKRTNNNVIKNIQNTHINFDNHKIKIPIAGWINFYKDNRIFDLNKVKINSITINKIPCGRYFANVLVENHLELPVKESIDTNKVIGIDMGIKNYITDSNGRTIDNPQYYEQYLYKIKFLQKKLSKKVKGSNRYNKLRLQIAKLFYKINNLRKQFLHNLTNKLLSENQTIIVETLGIQDMMEKFDTEYAQAMGSASWFEFVRILSYKADWQGKNVIKIGKYEPSTKMCSNCGSINNNLTIDMREWTCSCGIKHDRDINAAINIRNIGLKSLDLVA